MLRCMNSAISGMKINQTKLDVIGNNIANVNTTAFTSSRAEFKDMLYQNAGVATAPTSVLGGTNAKQVGLGAQLSSIDKIMTHGSALTTNKTLDVCIDGDGYFIVGKGTVSYADGGNEVDMDDGSFKTNDDGTTTTGAGIMSVAYTRDGNFTTDYQGNLVTQDGYRVMGYVLTDGNNESVVDAADGEGLSEKQMATFQGAANYVDPDSPDLTRASDKLQPLIVPTKVGNIAVTGYSIGKDGVILAVLADGTKSALGQIAMATFANPAGLTQIGNNKLQVSANSGTEIIKSSVGTEEDNDNSKAFGEMIQGALEGSNVDLTEQFTDMIVATRSFQASSKMITTGDEILQTITNLLR